MTSLPFASLLALQAAGGSTLTPFLVQVVAIFAIFYFLLIRPQQKQRKAHEERLRNLKKGDEVVTAGGVVGEVIHIRETTGDAGPVVSMDDRVTIKSGESRLVIERRGITKVSGPVVNG
ncbi:MAG TPA: preprotein translocase subunit YajC [Gemmatimonadaceae bacterium]